MLAGAMVAPAALPFAGTDIALRQGAWSLPRPDQRMHDPHAHSGWLAASVGALSAFSLSADEGSFLG